MGVKAPTGCLSYSAGPSGRPQYREKGGLRSTQLHATRYVPSERCRAEFLLLQVQLSSHQAFLSRCAVMGFMAANLPSPRAERRIEPRFYFISPLFGYSTFLITDSTISHGSLWPRSPSASLQPPENLDRSARNPGCLGWRHTLIVRLEQHNSEPLSASLSLLPSRVAYSLEIKEDFNHSIECSQFHFSVTGSRKCYSTNLSYRKNHSCDYGCTKPPET